MDRKDTDYISAYLNRDALERGLTQTEIAKAANVSRQTVYHFWMRHQTVTLQFLFRYAKCAGITASELLRSIADALEPENRGSLDRFMDEVEKRIAEKKRPKKIKKTYR